MERDRGGTFAAAVAAAGEAAADDMITMPSQCYCLCWCMLCCVCEAFEVNLCALCLNTCPSTVGIVCVDLNRHLSEAG